MEGLSRATFSSVGGGEGGLWKLGKGGELLPYSMLDHSSQMTANLGGVLYCSSSGEVC